MEKAKKSSKWGDFIAVVAALGTGCDPSVANETANNATSNNNLGPTCKFALAVIAEQFGIWESVYAIGLSGGIKALLDSIQVKSLENGKFSFNHIQYSSLEDVLRVAEKTVAPVTSIVARTVANMMDIDLSKPKVISTPIHNEKPLILSTPIGNTKTINEGFDINQENIVNEGFKGYDGPDTSVFEKKIHVLYEKPSKNGAPSYIGRTSGETDFGSREDIKKILETRDRNHHMNEKGFGDAEPLKASESYDVIRGLEQINIDKLGGAKSMGGTSSNAINSISKTNPKRDQYLDAAKKATKGE